MQILIAEDESTQRLKLKKLLTDLDYTVVDCPDGLKAWEIIETGDFPNILILDWEMPGMNGVEICKRVRKMKREVYVYILMITSKLSRNDVMECKVAGADDYIIKPYYPFEIGLRVRAGKLVTSLHKRLVDAKLALHDAHEDPMFIGRR